MSIGYNYMISQNYLFIFQTPRRTKSRKLLGGSRPGETLLLFDRAFGRISGRRLVEPEARHLRRFVIVCSTLKKHRNGSASNTAVTVTVVI